MAEQIMTAEEWMRRPSYHGSYDDYVGHMRGVQAYFDRLAEDRLVEKIAKRLSRSAVGTGSKT